MTEFQAELDLVPETEDDGDQTDEARDEADDIVLDDAPAPVKEINGAGISVTKTGKKRGTIFKCESCSKVSVFPEL